jgi:hypothetical protein
MARVFTTAGFEVLVLVISHPQKQVALQFHFLGPQQGALLTPVGQGEFAETTAGLA